MLSSFTPSTRSVPWSLLGGGAWCANSTLFYSNDNYLSFIFIIQGSIVNNGEENGGNQGVPAVAPTVSILPKFNSMAVFTVQPGRSYHSVQVV